MALDEDPTAAAPQHIDATGTGNNGTVSGNVSTVSGVAGNATVFDGTDDWIEIPDDNTLDFTNSMTLSLWFDLDGLSIDGNNPRPLSKGQSGNNNGSYSIRIRDTSNPSRVSFQARDGVNASETAQNSSLAYNDDNWHYVVCSYDGTTMTMYFDGQSSGTNLTNISIGNETRPLQIGAGRNRREWNGKIDEVRVSNAVKSSDWIATEFANINTPETFITLGAQKEADCSGPGGIDQMDGTSNLVLWLKADCGVQNSSYETVTDGNAVGVWRDQSGFGIDATESTNQPDYQENQVQGNPALNYTAANGDRLLSAGISDADEYMIFIVAEPNSYASSNIGLIHAAPTGNAFSGTTSTKSIGMWVSTSGTFWGRLIQTNGVFVNYTQSSTAELGTYFIMTNFADGSATTGQFIRGVEASASSSYDGTVQSWVDFGIGRQGTESWDGHIAEVIVFNRNLNDSERGQVENYLASKYGAEIPRLSGSTGPAGIGENDGSSRLEVWYDASDLDGDGSVEGTMESGQTAGTVSTWMDKSGHGYDLNTGSATFTDTNAGMNSLSTVDFNGSSEYLQTANIDIASANAIEFFMAWDDANFDGTNNNAMVNWETSGNVGGFSLEAGAATGRLRNRYYTGGSYTDQDINGFSLTDPYIYNTAYGSSGREFTGNGTSLNTDVTSIVLNNPATAPLAFGRNISTGANYFAVDIAEFISFSVELNDAEKEIVEQYLSAKYDIALSGTDYYTGHAADYTIGVQGIGTSDGTVINSHVESNASDGLIITMANASFGATNEYVFVGHNQPTDGGTTDDLSGLANAEARFSRVWYLDETGTVDVELTFDLLQATGASEFPAGDGYVLLYSPTSGPYVFEDWTTDNGIMPSVNEERISFVVTSAHLADGYYTVGSTDGQSNPLPIELVSFNAETCDNYVCLDWTTATEIDNNFFTIERTTNGVDFEEAGKVQGAGDSKEILYYSFIDKSPLAGVSFYRLKQTDYDGAYSHSEIVRIAFVINEEFDIYPNPTVGDLKITGKNIAEYNLVVYQINGKSIFVNSVKNGDDRLVLETNNLPSGIYFVTLEYEGRLITERIVKTR
ncbi:MAG: T9SS type A sorting domain-containing protein [Cyclobacteriaceae bacterium]